MKQRIEDIELLRGFAVIFVVIHHASDNLFTQQIPTLTKFYTYFGGWFGVDLFFAISGFVIARDLIPRLNGATSPLEKSKLVFEFWIRRAWRLFPSAWFWLGAILLFSLFFNQTGAFGSFRANFEATIAAVLQTANIRFAETFLQREYGASFAYWSLSLEEQFYLLLPLLIIYSRRLLPYTLILLVLLQLPSTRSPLLMSFRTDALALGVLIAIWTRNETFNFLREQFSTEWLWPTITMGALFICMGALASDHLKIVSIRVGLIAILSAILVLIASFDKNLFLFDGKLRRILLWMGSRSYAIYLIHIPAFFLTRELLHRTQQLFPNSNLEVHYYIIFAALFILILSELNYRYLEMPCRRFGSKLANNMSSKPSSEIQNHAK